MAIIQPVITQVFGANNIDGWQAVWGPMQAGDVGAAIGTTIGFGSASIAAPGGGVMSGFADKSIQAVGTFGTGGTAIPEGSNDGGLNWFQLNDAFGTPISITSPAMKEITEAVIWIRPHITSGDGTTSLTVTMFLRKTSQP